jgi:hypothetical protein
MCVGSRAGWGGRGEGKGGIKNLQTHRAIRVTGFFQTAMCYTWCIITHRKCKVYL